MRTLIGRSDRVKTPRWRALAAGVATLILAVALAGIGLLALAPSGAQAAGTFTFSDSDCTSANMGNLVANLLAAFSAGDSITYTGSSPCTVDLNQNTLTPTSGDVVDIKIEGGVGLTLDESNVLQNEIDFSMAGAGSSLTLDNVTLANNRTGIFAPGAASPTITVTNSTVSSNGGGIDAADAGSSKITVTNSTVSGIEAQHVSGVATDSPTITVTGSTIKGSSGDGIDVLDAVSPSITVTDSTVSNNAVTGIDAYGALGAHINLANSTISGNTDDGINAGFLQGGWVGITISGSTISGNGTDGVDIKGDPSVAVNSGAGPSISVTNSTLSGNTDAGIDAMGANGSSISVANSTISGSDVAIDARYNSGSRTKVVFSTIKGNNYDGIVAFGQSSAPTVSLTATILADNGPNNCAVGIPTGPVTDGGYNLSTDNTCGFSTNTSLPNGNSTTAPTDAQLALLPLGSYGGPTQTFALGPGSIAIDFIPSTDCGSLPAEDQRDITRPQGAGCDAGAYEAPAVTITTNPSQPASTGWYNATTLGGQGKTLGVSASFTGLATGELPTCSGATFTGLPATAVTGLTQTAKGSASLGDGTYSITCGVNQGTTPLGVSQSPTQPVSLKVDTTPPTINLTTPVNGATYGAGTTVLADYSCTDATSQIATTDGCVGTVANSSPIATTPGQHTFAVTAKDNAGNTSATTIVYTVGVPAPTLKINGATPQASPSWYNLASSPNGVTLTVSDTASTVTGYSCTDDGQPLSLTTAGSPVVGSVSLGDGVQTISCTATDGTNTSAATTVTIQVDLAPPTITSPAANAGYTLHQTVKLGCADVGSGLKTCQVTVTLPDKTTTTVSQGNDVPTSQPGVYTVTPNTVTDVAGNADTTSFAYTVSYQLVPMPGNTATVHHGYFALIRFAPEDVHGVDEASRTLTVTALELDGPGGQVIPFVHQFQFTMAHNTPQYQLELNTRNLSVGIWTVKIQIGTGATATTGTITFTVE